MKICKLLCIVLLAFGVNPAFGETLKIGFIGSLTGSAAAYGQSTKNGMELALEELPPEQRPQILFEDDQFSSAKTVSAFQKLLTQGVDLIITVGSGPSKAISPLAKKAHMPTIAWASDQNVSRGNEFIIRSYPSGFSEGAACAQEIQKRKIARTAAVASTNDYVASWMEGLKHVLGQSLIGSEELSPDTMDFKTIITRILAKSPDHVVICMNPGQNGLFAKQLRQVNTKVSISGCEYLSDSSEVKSADGALGGAWYVGITVKEAFINRYRERYGNTDVISGAANHYDLIKLLTLIPQDARKEKIIPALLALPAQDGAVGSFKIEQNGDDRFFAIPMDVRIIP